MLVAIVAPGVALQRLLRLRVDLHLVLPLGFAACAALYWLSLATGPWLFPAVPCAAAVGVAVDVWRARRAGSPFAQGPSWTGAVAPALALVAFLALTAYPFNRFAPDGSFRVDPVARIDTSFQVGVAWELAQGYPPQVPGLAGHPLSYPFGQHLVRGAAVRWVGLTPYGLLSRYDVTLCGLALVLALRALVFRLGGRGLALALAGWIPLLADASFLAAWLGDADGWRDQFSANLHLALTSGDALITALALLAGALVAWSRHAAGEGRGWIVVAGALALAVPFFKVFLALQLVAGLALAFALTRRRTLLALLAPLFLVTAIVAAAPGGRPAALALDPFAPVRRTAESLGWDAGSGVWLWISATLWVLSALGLRVVGVGELWRALRQRRPAALTLAGTVLSGALAALFVRVSFAGEGASSNEALSFVTSSAALLWVFAVLRLGAWAGAGRGVRVLALTALAALPATLHFVARKSATPPETIPAHVMRVVARLGADSRPGDVVIGPTSPRFPPPSLVFLGRRVPFTRFIPHLDRFARGQDVARRRAQVQDFFTTSDPRRALAVARELRATHLLLFGPQPLGFDPQGVLQELARDGDARLYRLEQAPRLDDLHYPDH